VADAGVGTAALFRETFGTHVLRSPECEEQDKADQFGAFSLTMGF
jgi:hypothetical protein